MFLTALQSNIPHENIARYCFSIIIKTFASRINPRTSSKFIPPPWYKEGRGLMETLPKVFNMLQYFETILPSMESL